MRRNLFVALTLMMLIGGIVLVRPGASQDTTPDRVAALETRVATLETQVAGGTTTGTGAVYTLTGTLLLRRAPNARNYTTVGSWCQGDGAYQDLREGAAVKVTDAAGKLIAVGHLGEGELGYTFAAGNYCGFPFTVTDVPEIEFYVIEVNYYGQTVFTFGDMEKAGWELSFEIGS